MILTVLNICVVSCTALPTNDPILSSHLTSNGTHVGTQHGCFLLADLKSQKVVQQNGDTCDVRLSPASTFKIVLSLIGYESGILKNSANPIWHYHESYKAPFSSWKLPQGPATWMSNSCVWYSQVLTKKLGMTKLKSYIQKFNYGNQNLSGDDGKNNGLTNAWLGSSLKISPREQMMFLQRMLNKKLSLSSSTYDLAKEILLIGKLKNGWVLYGKTGTALDKNNSVNSLSAINDSHEQSVGWFIGWITKDNRTLVVIKNIVGKEKDVLDIKDSIINFLGKNNY